MEGRKLGPDESLFALPDACTLLQEAEASFQAVWRLDDTSLGLSSHRVGERFGDDILIHVFPHLVHAGRFVCTRAEAVPLDEFIMSLPKPTPSTSTTRNRDTVKVVTPDIRAKILEEYPWFTDEDIKLALHSSGGHGSAGGAGKQKAPDDEKPAPPEPLNEEDGILAVKELREHREKWAWKDADAYAHFYVLDRGGKSTTAAKHVASDVVACYARSHCIKWCHAYGAGEMHSFAFKHHSSEDACHVLAREWCKKQNHYFQAWLAAFSPDRFDFSTILPYIHSDEFY